VPLVEQEKEIMKTKLLVAAWPREVRCSLKRASQLESALVGTATLRRR
jgi:hypothetical protein